MNNDYLLSEINEIPEIFFNFSKKIPEFVRTFAIPDHDEIWFVGSGDSHCAARYGASLFNQLKKRSIAFSSMELSRFHGFIDEKRPILIAISVSGETPRVIEAVRQFRSHQPRGH